MASVNVLLNTRAAIAHNPFVSTTALTMACASVALAGVSQVMEGLIARPGRAPTIVGLLGGATMGRVCAIPSMWGQSVKWTMAIPTCLLNVLSIVSTAVSVSVHTHTTAGA